MLATNVSPACISGCPKTQTFTNIKQNFQLNNCAITNNPRAQPLMQTAVKCSIIFNELKI